MNWEITVSLISWQEVIVKTLRCKTAWGILSCGCFISIKCLIVSAGYNCLCHDWTQALQTHLKAWSVINERYVKTHEHSLYLWAKSSHWLNSRVHTVSLRSIKITDIYIEIIYFWITAGDVLLSSIKFTEAVYTPYKSHIDIVYALCSL